jgi:hypothetical protein
MYGKIGNYRKEKSCQSGYRDLSIPCNRAKKARGMLRDLVKQEPFLVLFILKSLWSVCYQLIHNNDSSILFLLWLSSSLLDVLVDK